MMSLHDPNAQGGTSNVVTFRPHQYEGDKRMPREHVRWMLDFCQKMFRRAPGETQQFLDVGCGIGDLTREELLPRCLPCGRIVAVDLSAEMVEHAARHYHHDKLEFRKLDIESDEDVAEFVHEQGLFDRVYSFHAITWVRDQTKALKNVARLLKPRGECLLIFHASLRSFDINRNLAKMERWRKYSQVVDQLAPKTHDMSYNERLEYISRLLKEAGLSPSILELPVCNMLDNHSLDLLAEIYASKSPLTAVVLEDEKQQFLADLAQETAKMHSPDVDRTRYRIYVIKASKSNKQSCDFSSRS
ncbi:juvenile hormone acid O-methyltransferase-like [Dermacentor andersoni]|uniref:juvenile hormone acid O-methyltransferase-like n=1 Tax=Dermacentor andersoni TaxID=34620 RepID=UPI00241673C3|nr:juvenile hormone acid O-methyltransferase-like [Dermacentor andersoni]